MKNEEPAEVKRTKINVKVLRMLLAAREMKQAELAVYAGISPATLTNMINGKAYKSDTLDSIARVLDCDPRDLQETVGFPAPRFQAPSMADIAATSVAA